MEFTFDPTEVGYIIEALEMLERKLDEDFMAADLGSEAERYAGNKATEVNRLYRGIIRSI